MEEMDSNNITPLKPAVQDEENVDYWKAAEYKQLRDALKLSYTERFKIMMRLMRITLMLQRAKLTHKKFSS
ncbi:MAG TPA: hypothetical protein PKC39_07525 [Ferruginibacter sp.]|nr:hypothetical protein [Ferruginibacter sp.]HMP20793.1 hypothetical protein [Ferruginibacter sp.]